MRPENRNRKYDAARGRSRREQILVAVTVTYKRIYRRNRSPKEYLLLNALRDGLPMARDSGHAF